MLRNRIARPMTFNGGVCRSGSAQKTVAAAPTLIANASFEDVENGLPKGWQPIDWDEKGQLAVDEAVVHSGRRSVRISSTDGHRTRISRPTSPSSLSPSIA